MKFYRRFIFSLTLCCAAFSGHSASLEQVSYGLLADLPQRTADSVFRYGTDPLQRIYLWQAATQSTASVVFIHGGCWLNAYDIQHSVGFLTELAEQGYTVFGIEYRRTGDDGGGWPGTFDDIRTALGDIGSRVNTSQPVYVLGHSAGGHLALLAAPALFYADKVIGLAAITDIKRYAQGQNSCQTATPAFMQRTLQQAPDDWYDANPRNLDMPPSVMLLQGTEDNIVPPGQAKWDGVDHTLIDGAGHFDWLHPDSTAFAALLKVLKVDNDSTTPER